MPARKSTARAPTRCEPSDVFSTEHSGSCRSSEREAAVGSALASIRVMMNGGPRVPCLASLTPVSHLANLVARDRNHDCEGFGAHRVCVRVEAVAHLPTRFGRFEIVAFWNNRDEK